MTAIYIYIYDLKNYLQYIPSWYMHRRNKIISEEAKLVRNWERYEMNSMALNCIREGKWEYKSNQIWRETHSSELKNK